MTWIEGVDYSYARPDPAGLLRAGKHFALRYVSPQAGKNLTVAERNRLWKAGLGILLLFEDGADNALEGHAAGVRDARLARRLAAALGYPASLPVYYAIDFDATPAQLAGAVTKYVQGVNSVDPNAAEYGGIRTVDYLVAHGLATGGFQTYAWSAGKWSTHAKVRQYHNGVNVAGGEVDLCRADSTQQLWRTGMATTLTEDDIKALTAAIVGADIDPEPTGKYTLAGSLWTILQRTALLNTLTPAAIAAAVVAALPPAGSTGLTEAQVTQAIHEGLATLSNTAPIGTITGM